MKLLKFLLSFLICSASSAATQEVNLSRATTSLATLALISPATAGVKTNASGGYTASIYVSSIGALFAPTNLVSSWSGTNTTTIINSPQQYWAWLQITPNATNISTLVQLAATSNALAGATTTVSNLATYLPFKITASGLVATVGSGVLNFPDGTTASVAQQTVNLTPSTNNYIVIRLDTNHTAHAYYRAFDSASVVVGSVVAGASTVTSINQVTNIVIPPNACYPINNRLRNTNSVKCLIIGDSYTYGAGGTPYFFDLLWNSANAASGYNVPNISSFTLKRKANPGTAWRFGHLMISETFYPYSGASGWTWDTSSQCFAMLPRYNSEQASLYVFSGPNPYVTTSYDVVIIAIGTNYDALNLERIESQITFWQRRGAVVMLCPGSRRLDGGPSDTATDPRWKTLADAHGCAFADTDAAYQEAVNNYNNFGGTNPTDADLVHLSTYGQTIWAQCILPVQCPVNYQTVPAQNLEKRRIIPTAVLSAPMAQACYNWNGSGLSTAATAYAADCPSVVFGGRLAASAVTLIAPGGYVAFSHPCVAGGVYWIAENQAGENCTWSVTDGASTVVTGSITGATLPFQIGRLVTQATVQSFWGANNYYTNFSSRGLPVGVGLRFNNTSASQAIKLVGMMVETPTIKQLPISEITATGATVPYDEVFDSTVSSRVISADAINTVFSTQQEDCNGLMMLLRTGNKSGVLRIETDGIEIALGYDTYNATTSPALLPITVFPGSWPTYATASVGVAGIRLDNNFGPHSMTVRLMSTNASCLPSVAGQRPLTAAGLFKLDMR